MMHYKIQFISLEKNTFMSEKTEMSEKTPISPLGVDYTH
jgi:hypothetical protein